MQNSDPIDAYGTKITDSESSYSAMSYLNVKARNDLIQTKKMIHSHKPISKKDTSETKSENDRQSCFFLGCVFKNLTLQNPKDPIHTEMTG